MGVRGVSGGSSRTHHECLEAGHSNRPAPHDMPTVSVPLIHKRLNPRARRALVPRYKPVTPAYHLERWRALRIRPRASVARVTRGIDEQLVGVEGGRGRLLACCLRRKGSRESNAAEERRQLHWSVSGQVASSHCSAGVKGKACEVLVVTEVSKATAARWSCSQYAVPAKARSM